MQKDWNFYVLNVLREEILSRESELEALRNSLRFRVGGWVLEALPFGRNTFLVFFKLVKIFFKRRAAIRPVAASNHAVDHIDRNYLLYDTIVFGDESPSVFRAESSLCTQEASVVARVLDTRREPGSLVIRRPDIEIARRLERSRKNGWHVIWCPEEGCPANLDPLIAYLKAHVDQCLDVECP